MSVSASSRTRPGRLARILLVLALVVLAGIAPSAQAGPENLPLIEREAYPNMVPYPPYHIHAGHVDYDTEPPPYALRFSVTTANQGEVPFDFEAQEPEEEEGSVIAAQCVRWLLDRHCTERRAAGYYIYHHAHGHYHILDFAKYELRRLTADNKPDMSPEALVAGGQKVSFCIVDTDYDNPGPTWTVPITTRTEECGEGSQGISPGWADTYDHTLEGQQIPLAGVPDGTYALVITFDPTNRFFEEPRTDNISFAVVAIEEGGTVAYEVPIYT